MRWLFSQEQAARSREATKARPKTWPLKTHEAPPRHLSKWYRRIQTVSQLIHKALQSYYWKVAKSSGCRIILVHKDWETQAPVFFSCLASVSSVYRGYLSLSKTRRSKETRSMSEHSLVWNQHIFHFPSKTVSEVKEIARPVNSASVDSAAFQLQSSSHGTNKIRTATSELYWLYCLVLQSLFHLSDNHVKPIHKLYTSVWLQLVQLAVRHHIGCT